MPAVDIDRDAAREAAERELAKPIYPKASLTERLTEWLQDLLYRIVREGSTIPGGWFTITVLLIILAVAVVVAVRIARRTMRTNRGAEHALFDSRDQTAAQHRAAAERAATESNWTEAIRHRLRAVARQLEQDGVLDAVPGRTASELARDAGVRAPDLQAQLTTAADTFNDVSYGERPGTEPGYRMIADLDDRLRSRGRQEDSAPPAPLPADIWAPLR